MLPVAPSRNTLTTPVHVPAVQPTNGSTTEPVSIIACRSLAREGFAATHFAIEFMCLKVTSRPAAFVILAMVIISSTKKTNRRNTSATDKALTAKIIFNTQSNRTHNSIVFSQTPEYDWGRLHLTDHSRRQCIT